MRLRVLTATLLMVFCLACTHAQVDDTYMTATDSAAFVGAKWQVEQLDGLELRHHHFTHQQIFASNQNFSIIIIPKGSKRSLHFAYDTLLTPTSQIAQRYDALAAVNGSFFDMGKGNPICYLRIDSTRVGQNTPAKTDSINRKYYQSGAIALDHGRVKLLSTHPSRIWEDSVGYPNLMTAGPLLIHHGHPLPMRDDRTFVTKRHNRTALGIRKDGAIVLLVADGRFKRESEGLSLTELIQVMQWMDCIEAINLDGGGSSTLYAKGHGTNGIANFPSDNNRFDHEGERPVSNIIYVK